MVGVESGWGQSGGWGAVWAKSWSLGLDDSGKPLSCTKHCHSTGLLRKGRKMADGGGGGKGKLMLQNWSVVPGGIDIDLDTDSDISRCSYR